MQPTICDVLSSDSTQKGVKSFADVHVCKRSALQVQDFLMRVRSKRFPSIEEDMKMLQAHCGSLLLDPAILVKVNRSVAFIP